MLLIIHKQFLILWQFHARFNYYKSQYYRMNWTNKKILIAEDELANFLLLVEYLEPTGIQIFHASNGLEVLEILKDTTPHVILLDMKMPEIDGFELINRLRKENIQIPIIAQTAYTMEGDKEKILSAGCNDYIAKPIDEDILLEKISLYVN